MDETLTNYDAFFTKLMANYGELQKTAEDKLAQEQLSIGAHINIPSWIPGVGDDDKQGDNTACGFAESRELLRDFGAERLCGDYNALQNMKASLDAARAAINSGEAGQDPGQGFDSDVVDLAGGLGSWKTNTANTFRDKYVDPIGATKTRQYEAVGISKTGVETAINILVETRKAALQLPLDAKKALDAYNPVKSVMKGNARVVFRLIGFVVKPAKWVALAITVSDLEKSGLSVATLMQAFRQAVITCRDNKINVEREISGLLDGFAADRSKAWAQHVCARPAP